MKIKQLKRVIIGSSVYALLIVAALLFTPFAAQAQTVYYGDQGEVIGTSDSRMVATIVETDDKVELSIMAIGEMYADVFSFTLIYQPDALTLTDETYGPEIPLGLDPSDFGSPVLSLEPSFLATYPKMSLAYVMNHQSITGGTAAGMRSLDVNLGVSDHLLASVMHLTSPNMIPVCRIYFKKKNPGMALTSADLGYYSKQTVPRSISQWGFRGTTINFGQGGAVDNYYLAPELFTYRSPSYVVTDSISEVFATTATLNGTFKRGDLAPSTTMTISSNVAATATGLLNYDDIHEYGFMYALTDDSIRVDGISKKITINEVEYTFPTAAQIAAASGVISFGTTTMYFKPFTNSVSDQTVPYTSALENLTANTDYYVWTYEHYSFETSDTYLAVGNKLTFNTASCDQPEDPEVLSSQAFCGTPTIANLIATVEPGATLVWYDAETGGTAYESTDLLVNGNTYYARAESGVCSSLSVAVNVTITDGLMAPVATTPQAMCTGSLVSDLQATGINIQWYDAETGGNLLSDTDVLVDGQIYYAGQSSAICGSTTRTAVKVITGNTIDAPVVESPQYFCNDATLADIATDGSAIVWYSANGAILPSTTYLSNGVTYYAAKVSGDCESADRVPVLVYTGLSSPNAPNVSSPQHLFEGATVSNIAVPNNQIIWYASATSTTPLDPSTMVGDNVTYYAAQKAGDCESTERTPVLILINGVQGPDVLSPQTFCGEATLADLTVTGTGIVWYDAQTGGNELPSSTVLTSTPTVYYVAQSADSNESDRVGIIATANPVPVPTVGDIDICNNGNNGDNSSTFDLTTAVITDPNYTYTYYSDMNGTVITDASQAEMPSSAGVVTYYVKATDKETGCESDYMPINVTVNPAPQVTVNPLGAYTSVDGTITITVTDDNTSTDVDAKTIVIKDPSIADVTLVNGVITVTGKKKGNTEIVYTSVNEYGCVTEYIIPVQVEGAPTGILTGKDVILCNVPGGGDTQIVQIAYIMGGVAPWTVTISDDRGTFTQDVVVSTIDELPVNVTVTIPENTGDVPEFTNYVISNIIDDAGAAKDTHYGVVRIGTNPTPVVKTIANKVQSVCAGSETLPVTFSGVATVYMLDVDKNIGAMNFAKDAIPSFVAVNNGTQADTATIVITPQYWYNGVVCIGEADTATIIVKPRPTVDPVNNQILCANDNLTVNFTGTADEYNWTASGASIGVPASGSGDINLAVANTSKAPAVVTFTVSPKNNTTNSDCEGESVNFTVTVMPSATVNSIANQELCYGQMSNIIAFSGDIPGTVYRWTNDNPLIGLAASGAGDIASFAAINNGTAAVTATITVTPEYTYGNETCVNTTAAKTFTITVHPVPTVSTVFDANYCAAATVPGVILLPNSIWRQSGNYVGLSSLSGTGDVPAFTAVNNTSQPQTAYFEITPMSGTCKGTAVNYRVTVAPAINMISTDDMGTICSDQTFSYTALSNVSNVNFTWSRPAVTGISNAAASGVGAAINETLYNHTDAAIEVKYYINMTYSDCSSEDSVVVMVNPTPVLDAFQSVAQVCNGGSTVDLTYTLNPAQSAMPVNYSISFNQDALWAGFINITNATLSGGVITVSLPASLASGNYSGTLRIGSTSGCVSTTTYPFTIQVMGGVQIISQPESSYSLCTEEDIHLSVVATGINLTYQWYFNDQPVSGATSSTYTVPGNAEIGIYYVEVISDCGSVKSNAVNIKENSIQIMQKWDDVVFVSNVNNAYVGYQWYHESQAIGKNGIYQYYSQNGGLDGTYQVLVKYADGTTQMSCPYTVVKQGASSGSVSIYPNPVQIGKEIVIDLSGLTLDESLNAKVFIYDASGKQMGYYVVKNPVENITVNVPVAGNYVVSVTTASGKVKSEKIVVVE